MLFENDKQFDGARNCAWYLDANIIFDDYRLEPGEATSNLVKTFFHIRAQFHLSTEQKRRNIIDTNKNV